MKFKKSFLIGLLALGAGFAAPVAAAGSKYYVALTTVPVSASVAEYNSQYPNITGNLYVRKIVVANSTATVTQTISVYDTCTSTTAASLKFQFYTGAASQVQPDYKEFDFLPQSFRLTTPCFKKSGTTSTVDLTVFYE